MGTLSDKVVRATIEAAKDRNVSKVATGSGGFGPAYLRAGSLGRLSKAWQAKREAFLARHLAQALYNQESLWVVKSLLNKSHR